MLNKKAVGEEIVFTVNGQKKQLFAKYSDTLLFTLRDELGLMGAKPGCLNGDCGACTILIDGMPNNACHLLTIEIQNKTITTIEGLDFDILKNAFIDNWAIQCGYCTPGFLLNSYALIQNHPDADDAMIDEWLSSNICRCTGYMEIKEAVKQALQKVNTND